MNSQRRKYTLAFCVATTLAIVGCTTPPPTIDNLRFIETPADISTAWVDREGNLFIVPEKGVLVEAAQDPSGRPVPMAAHGSYLKIHAQNATRTDRVRLLIEGRWRVLPTQ